MLKMYEEILVFLKKRRDQVGILLKKMMFFVVEFEKKKVELERKVGKKCFWVKVFCFIFSIGMIVGGILYVVGDKNLVEVVVIGNYVKI